MGEGAAVATQATAAATTAHPATLAIPGRQGRQWRPTGALRLHGHGGTAAENCRKCNIGLLREALAALAAVVAVRDFHWGRNKPVHGHKWAQNGRICAETPPQWAERDGI